jgi:hypothetical protein
MSSSTSSSSILSSLRRGWQAVWTASARQVSAIAAPLALAAIMIGALIVVSDMLPPRQGERGLEKITVREQLRRARVVSPEVLIIGDSSALMDVEARELSSLLGFNVESLATLAWVGPAGYGRIVRLLSERASAPRVIVLLMCATGLAVDEPAFAENGWEQMVLEGQTDEAAAPERTRAQRSFGRVLLAARDRIYTRLFLPLVGPPLPGRHGFYYGWPEDVARALDRSQGSLVDPSLPDTTELSVPCHFELSDAVERRLRAFAEATRSSGVQKTYFGITPVPQTAVVGGTLARRAATASRCLAALRLPPSAELPLPAACPARRFATFNHLGAEGRQEYSRLLAQLLRTRVSSVGASSDQ